VTSPSGSALLSKGKRTAECIANLYCQAGAPSGARGRRDAENRIQQEAPGDVLRSSCRAFRPMVRGSSPRAGTKSELSFPLMDLVAPMATVLPWNSQAEEAQGGVRRRREEVQVGRRTR
jgi:hypothetical protein